MRVLTCKVIATHHTDCLTLIIYTQGTENFLNVFFPVYTAFLGIW